MPTLPRPSAPNPYAAAGFTRKGRGNFGLNNGLGALVDADLAKESAQLQALQIRQQLGTQALTLADQAPATLLALVKNA
jgi:hypothetical protein